jgi:hypothetical protein
MTKIYHYVNLFIDFRRIMTIIDISQIQAQIRRIAKTGSGGVALSRHCKEESMPERNVDFQDILTQVLQ